MDLKVGQSCEVVEILNEGGFGNDNFKVRGFTVGEIELGGYGINCLTNGSLLFSNSKYLYMSLLEKEIKVWGKLTVTKVK